MPQPLNRFELIRLKSNNFKKNSFKLSSASTVKEKVVFDSLRRVRIEDVTDVEQTFSVMLSSTPVLWDGTIPGSSDDPETWGNTIPASLSGGVWPDIDVNADIWDRLEDQYYAGKIYIQPVVKIENQPYLNFDISYPMLLEVVESTLTFKLKRLASSKPIQLLEAPVSKMKRPLTSLIVAFISK